ncbi:MAG: DNA-binding domain-containing protein [Kiritimatiellia bacterium]
MEAIMNEMKSTLESILYRVVKNSAASLQTGTTVYSAIVELKETYNITDIAKRMASEGCVMKESAIRLVLTEFADLVGTLVAEGRAVNIGGLVRFVPTIRGTFESPTAPWDASKNHVLVNAMAGNKLRQAAKESSAVRTTVLPPPPPPLVPPPVPDPTRSSVPPLAPAASLSYPKVATRTVGATVCRVHPRRKHKAVPEEPYVRTRGDDEKGAFGSSQECSSGKIKKLAFRVEEVLLL